MRSLILGVLLLLTSGQMAAAQRIVQSPAGLDDLQEAWSWGAEEKPDATLAWSVEGTSQHHWIGDDDESLAELLGLSTSVRRVAILVDLEGGKVVDVDNVSLHQGGWDVPRVIVWLGAVSQTESFELLRGLSFQSDEARKGSLYAASLHRSVDEAGAYVERHLTHRSVPIRKAAAYALASHRGEEALGRLLEVAKGDANSDVSKAAAYAIGSIETDGALDALQEILDDSSTREIRKAAVYAIGNVGTPRARRMLLELIRTEQ